MEKKRSLRWLKNACNVVCLFYVLFFFFCSNTVFLYTFHCFPHTHGTWDKKCEGRQFATKKVMTLYLPWINKFYNVLGVSSHVVVYQQLNVVVIIVVVAASHVCVAYRGIYKYKNENVK